MRFPTFCILIFSIVLNSFGQKVSVIESEEVTDEIKRKGISTVLEIDVEVVKEAWTKKLKEFGNTKAKSWGYLVEQANIATISASLIKIYSKIEPTSKGTKIWWALDLGDVYLSSSADKSKFDEAVKLLHDFGVNLYIQDINIQIKEVEKVLSFAVKDQEKMMVKAESIRSSIARNRQEKMKLDQRLAENLLEYKLQVTDSIQNVKNQIASTENVDKMKKAVEAVKAKISKVE
jgi:hypothetical protein